MKFGNFRKLKKSVNFGKIIFFFKIWITLDFFQHLIKVLICIFLIFEKIVNLVNLVNLGNLENLKKL